MTKPFLVSNFHFPVYVRKHAGGRSNTQVEHFEVDVMIDAVEADPTPSSKKLEQEQARILTL